MRTGRIAMTMQLAPIPPRKVEFTPEACLEVVERWLEKEYKLTPAKSEILYVEGVPWLSFEKTNSEKASLLK